VARSAQECSFALSVQRVSATGSEQLLPAQVQQSVAQAVASAVERSASLPKYRATDNPAEREGSVRYFFF